MVAQLAFSDIILFEKWLNLVIYELIDATFNEYQFHYTSSFLHIYWTETTTKMAAEIVKIVEMVIST